MTLHLVRHGRPLVDPERPAVPGWEPLTGRSLDLAAWERLRMPDVWPEEWPEVWPVSPPHDS